MEAPLGRPPSAVTLHRGAALAAAAGVGISVGVATVASKAAVAEVGPAILTFLRYAIALACLLPFAAPVSWRRLPRRDLAMATLLGLAQFAVLAGLFHLSLLFIPAARAAVIFATLPLLTLVLAIRLGRERGSWLRALGMVLCVLGVAAAIGEREILVHPRAWVGDLAVLGSAVTGALCNLFFGPLAQRHGARRVSVLSMAPAVALLLPAALLLEGWPPADAGVTLTAWLAVALAGLASAAGFLLLTWALARAAASEVSAFFSLGPIVATGLGVWLLGEPVTVQFLLGVALVSSGLWLALAGASPRRPDASSSRR